MTNFLGDDDWVDDWARQSARRDIQQPIKDEAAAREAAMIHANQEAFQTVTDALIALYRAFDTTPRGKLKPMMKELYEKLKVLGEKLGVSRVGLDSIWKG